MYTIPRGTPVNAELIQSVIEYKDNQVKRLTRLQNYYLGDQDINSREKSPGLSNNKVVVNHAKYIVDINTSYLLGNPVDYQATEGVDIEPLRDAYKEQTINDLDVEIAKTCGIYGKAYEYVYANEESKPKSALIDNRNIVIVRDDSMEHNKLFAVLYRPVYNSAKQEVQYYEITIADKATIGHYKLDHNTLIELEPEQVHAFGDVPVIEYKNNAEEQGDFENVISLIDAYNLLQSDRLNDKEQLVDAILCFTNMDFDEEDAEALRVHRVISRIPADGKVEYLTKTLNEADTDVLRKTIEQDIHKISMVPNMSDENFIGNASGVAIRYKLLAFEQNIQNKERSMEKGLMERFTLYNNYLSTKEAMQQVKKTEVDAVFKRNLPSNDYETSQMIMNLDGKVDTETLIAQLSFIKDAQEIVGLAKKEKEAEPAQPTYEELMNNEE